MQFRLQARASVRALVAISSTVAAAAVTLPNSIASGAMIVVGTPAASTTGGQPVSARATITTGANQVVVFLENLQADPKSVTQALSGFQFHLTTGQTTGTLASSSGKERVVNGNGSFVDGATVATGWSLGASGSDLKLNLLGTPTAPNHTIIGPPNASNLYANSNPSINNGVHSPFFGLNATFTLNVPGVTAASQVTDAIFQFNTGPGNTITGFIPEPGTISALAAMALLSVRRRRAG